ncbi:hypothetical protein DPEC_G00051370 [Dallia pectoralis]|uniref:Uncharacterized protein n=1 Tax=Dallia pectoralis TaxID=75939 RepID=A0ACC2HB81_DALPE|nr:hypothetical protein DPEC_G00051370 [Dallia pectoralis]
MFNTGENRYISSLWAVEKGKSSMRLFVILTVLSAVNGLLVTIPKREYEVNRGNSISLTCSFIPAKPDNNLVIITWTMEADQPEEPKIMIATYYSNPAQVDIKPSYKDRVDMVNNIPGGTSTLTLRQTTMQESRLWQCRVQIPGDDEGTLSAVTELVVLVGPSVPVVRVQGEAEYWANINLTCVSEEGSPTPTYNWKTYDVRNNPRQFPMKTTEKNGVLSLFNISMETSGFFICTAANKINSSSFNYTLTVMPPSMKIGSTLAIVGGVLAGLTVLGIVVYCCRSKRNKEKQKVVYGDPEVEFQDHPTVKVVTGYHDDISDGKPEGSLGLEEVDRDDRSVITDRSDGQKKSDDNRLDDQRDRYGVAAEIALTISVTDTVAAAIALTTHPCFAMVAAEIA